VTGLWTQSHTLGTKTMPRRDSFDEAKRDLFGDSPQTSHEVTWPT
jgi:hypothetical protein